MSFRLRVFVLVVLIAATAIGATAFLTLRLTTNRINDAQDTIEEYTAAIADSLTRYGLVHGTWTGVPSLVAELSDQTGLRIRLVTIDTDTVVVDTDNMAGRAASPVRPYPQVVDPRPAFLGTGEPTVRESGKPRRADEPVQVPRAFLDKVRGIDADAPLFGPDPVVPKPPEYDVVRMVRQLAQYRAALHTVACIEDDDAVVPALQLTTPPYLTPEQIAGHPDCVQAAEDEITGRAGEINNDWNAFFDCVGIDPKNPFRDESFYPHGCVEQVFLERVSHSAAPSLQLFLGVPEETDVGALGRPAAFGAAGLLVVALIGTALVARQVTRPVRELTTASRLIAGGRLDVRVPVDGRTGDLAQLSRSFNYMTEAVRRSEERQRRLVADVAHELRTPLSNLRGYLEGLSDGVIAPSRELFASLHEETLLQGRILDDLQVLALAEAGALDYARAPVDLAELARAAATAHRAVAAEAGLTLVAHADAPVWISADRERLRQVIGNLLTNAIRYTDPGGDVTVTVAYGPTTATLAVSDTGSGIAPEDLARVFDRFWRADPARQRATGGSGLGLTIAHRIVTDHGGDIAVASTPGVGSTFTVSLPRAVPLQ